MAKTLIIVGLAVLILGVAVAFALHKPSKSSNASVPQATNSNVSLDALKYLPLGDSYTIGESVKTGDRWPNQLVDRLAKDNVDLNIVANPSVTGYTTQNLIDRELPLLSKLHPDFVTIQIGVNDYVQGVDAQTFQKKLEYILNYVQKQLPQPGNIVLVTIPDYAKTPTGARFGDPVAATAAIANFNKIIAQAGAAHSLPVADVFLVSQKVVSDPSLIAGDGLHPSGKEYTAWTDIIYQTLNSSTILK